MNGFSNRLFKEFRLRSTPSRQEILHLFLKREYALSHGDIEKEISNDLDRVTVYRTLKTFLDKGLIHKVLDDAGTLKYALCTDACAGSIHHHNHVHFKCTTCGQTNCLDIEIPSIRLPKGYRASEQDFLVQGVCQGCIE